MSFDIISVTEGIEQSEPIVECFNCHATDRLHHLKVVVTLTQEREDQFLCDKCFQHFKELARKTGLV